jgi:hypothetical protein
VVARFPARGGRRRHPTQIHDPGRFWREGNTWQKAVQAGAAFPNLGQLTQQNGPLVSEQRMPGDWHSADRVTMHGYLVFQNRKVVTYGYDLTVAPAQNGGGGQPGTLVAGNYRTP